MLLYDKNKETTGARVFARYVAIFLIFSVGLIVSALFDFPDDYINIYNHVVANAFIYGLCVIGLIAVFVLIGRFAGSGGRRGVIMKDGKS